MAGERQQIRSIPHIRTVIVEPHHSTYLMVGVFMQNDYQNGFLSKVSTENSGMGTDNL